LLCYRPEVPAELERRPTIRLIDRLLPEPVTTVGSRGGVR
jgi:hypothetical protein